MLMGGLNFCLIFESEFDGKAEKVPKQVKKLGINFLT
jgi:hypothetical protein